MGSYIGDITDFAGRSVYQVGWGVVNLSNIQPIHDHLAGIDSMPQRPADVVACMEANQAMREAYWGS